MVAKTREDKWQILRGLCIISVVLIHCDCGVVDSFPNTSSEFIFWVIIRCIINFAVPSFIFMTGYFISPEKIELGYIQYLKSRIGRLLVPYVIWSLIYAFKRIALSIITGENIDFLTILYKFVSGEFQLYYIIALAQLTILTPVLYRICKTESFINKIIYIISPIYILFLFLYNFFFGGNSPLYQTFFFLWISIYYLGMQMKINPNSLEKIVKILGNKISIFIALMLSVLESFMLIYVIKVSNSFSITHLKIMTMVYATTIVLYFYRKKAQEMYGLGKIIITFGNNSFGIFFVHTFIIMLVRPLMKKVFSTSLWFACMSSTFVVSLFFSLIMVVVVKKVLLHYHKEKYINYLGLN